MNISAQRRAHSAGQTSLSGSRGSRPMRDSASFGATGLRGPRKPLRRRPPDATTRARPSQRSRAIEAHGFLAAHRLDITAGLLRQRPSMVTQHLPNCAATLHSNALELRAIGELGDGRRECLAHAAPRR